MANDVLNSERDKPKKKRARSKHRTTTEDEIPLSPHSDRSDHDQTKAAFDQLLQTALTQSQDPKTKKKGTNLLESLRKGDGLKKEDDSLLIANTYDPDDTKGGKSNKRRQKERERSKDSIDDKGHDNIAYENEEPVKPRRKKKNPKSPDHTVNEQEMSISELSTSTTEPKKRKKKKPKADSESEQVLSEEAEPSGDDLNRSQDNLISPNEEEGETTKAKKKKKKKKKDPAPESAELAEAYQEQLNDADNTSAPGDRIIHDEGRIIGITVHRTDKLKTDFFIAHPLVRCSLVDLDTGHYVSKQQKNRPVSSYYENENVDKILPIMTQPFDFKQNRSILPVWEELLILNENFNYVIQAENPKVMAFFELLDFVSMNTAGQRYNTSKQDGGWHRIAWGFLKLCGSNGKPNTDKKARLQLYQPPNRFRKKGDLVEIFQWWKSAARIPYPSTLYVTVKGIVPPSHVEPGARTMNALQEERGRSNIDIEGTLGIDPSTGTLHMRESMRRKGPSLWNRLPGQVCRIPNCQSLTLQVGRKGCSVARFSHDGKLLACGINDKDGYPIRVFEIPSGKVKGELDGHYSIIYDMDWGRNDKQLVTASADGTAKVWNISKISNQKSPEKLLPHPSFVYTAKFHIRVQKVIVTGGYDKIIRVWTTETDEGSAQLVQELDGHMNFINTLCFDDEGSKLYSGDSTGILRVWNAYTTDKPSTRGVLKDWTLNREIDDPEIKGVCINSIKLHPNGRRLLIHCRDNHIRMYDLRVNAVMQRYIGAVNFREHIRSSLTPCGTFVVSGGEDGCAYVWNAETGDQVACYADLGYKKPVCDADFHPHEHMVVFACYGDNYPVVVYKYDGRIAQRDAGFETEEEATMLKRAKSPDLRPGVSIRSEDDGLETNRSKVVTARENLESVEISRLERVKRKLETVTAFTMSGSRPMSPEHPLAVPRPSSSTLGGTSNMMTWGSTFDSTLYDQYQRNMSPEPGTFSPHASGTGGRGSVQQQQYASQSEYMRRSGGWRPGFSGIGRSGSGFAPPAGRPPQLSINATQGRPQFSFQGAKGTQLSVDERQVVALYDYQGQRSDDLSFVRGDLIVVLYKDSENWWMGELEDGQQGYFPANYVAGYKTEEAARAQAGEDLDLRLNLGQDDDDDTEVRRSTTAVVTNSGDLQFISGDESDAHTSNRRKKKKPKQVTTTVTIEQEDTPTRPARKKKRPKAPIMAESTA